MRLVMDDRRNRKPLDKPRTQDNVVKCDLCGLWHHHVCAEYPVPDHLPYKLSDDAKFACARCVAEKKEGVNAQAYAQMRALQDRTADSADIEHTEFARGIEVATKRVLDDNNVKLANDVVIRVGYHKEKTFEVGKIGARREKQGARHGVP